MDDDPKLTLLNSSSTAGDEKRNTQSFALTLNGDGEAARPARGGPRGRQLVQSVVGQFSHLFLFTLFHPYRPFPLRPYLTRLRLSFRVSVSQFNFDSIRFEFN